MHLTIKIAATRPKPAKARLKNLDLTLVRAGGLGLYSRDFQSFGLGARYESTDSVSGAVYKCPETRFLGETGFLEVAFLRKTKKPGFIRLFLLC
jgi:hypothetical protein